MNLLMITGKLALGSCGVCDYTNNLYNNFPSRDLLINKKTYKEVKVKDLKLADIILINYPCPEYGYSLMPLLKVLIGKIYGKQIVYVLHEYSYVHFIRKLVILIFLFISNKIVSVTEEEINRMPYFIRRKMKYIPITTNIKFIENKKKEIKEEKNNNLFTITFFGAFYPAKKVEKLIKVVDKLYKDNFKVRLYLIGAKHPYHLNYLNQLEQLIKENQLEPITYWYIDCPEEKISELLSESDVCVLPFEEGVTLRRGTFLTSIQYSLPVVTTEGKDTPQIIRELRSVFFANDENEMEKILKDIYYNREEYKKIASLAKESLELWDWNKIGVEYYNFIKNGDKKVVTKV